MRKPVVNVFAGGRLAGVLDRSTRGDDVILFTYEPDCPPDAAVSITMDVGPDQYDSMGGLLPIFEMNLPEGVLKERQEVLAEARDVRPPPERVLHDGVVDPYGSKAPDEHNGGCERVSRVWSEPGVETYYIEHDR